MAEATTTTSHKILKSQTKISVPSWSNSCHLAFKKNTRAPISYSPFASVSTFDALNRVKISLMDWQYFVPTSKNQCQLWEFGHLQCHMHKIIWKKSLLFKNLYQEKEMFTLQGKVNFSFPIYHIK